MNAREDEKNMRDTERGDRILELLGRLPPVEKSKGFHERFWRRFELEKISAVPPVHAPSLLTSRMLILGLGLGGLCLALGLGLAFFVPDRPSALLIQGEVSLQGRVDSPDSLATGEPLRPGDEIMTGPSGWVILELGKGYRVKVQPDSLLRIEHLKPHFFPGRTAFQLLRGEVLFKIGLGAGEGYPLDVFTENALVAAVGTEFAVRAPTPKVPASLVTVLQGKVRVGPVGEGEIDRQSLVSVDSGYEIFVSRGIKSLTPIKIIEERRRMLEELFQFGKRNQAILLLSFSPDRVNELLAPCAIYIHLEYETGDFTAIKDIVARMGEAAREGDSEGELRLLRGFEKFVEGATELDPVSVSLFVGAYYAHLRRYDEAVSTFEDTARDHPSSSYRSLALLAAAKIYHEGLRNDARALELVMEVLREYPQSLETVEAQSFLGLLQSAP